MRKTVLIAEDDRLTNKLVATTFYEQGFDVVAAHNGAEALKLAAEHRPIAVILDLAMPVMDGRTFYRRLRAEACEELRDIPVLILSAYGAEEAREELGAQAAIPKPFKHREVVLAVMQMLKESHEG